MDLFWIFAFTSITTIYFCGRWFYCYNQQYAEIKNGKKREKRLYTVKDCATGNHLVVEMNDDFAITGGTTLE